MQVIMNKFWCAKEVYKIVIIRWSIVGNPLAALRSPSGTAEGVHPRAPPSGDSSGDPFGGPCGTPGPLALGDPLAALAAGTPAGTLGAPTGTPAPPPQSVENSQARG